MLIDTKEGYLCVSNVRYKSSIPLTLTNCLHWCHTREKRFCMWNYLSNETQEVDDDDDRFSTSANAIISSCYASMKCNNRTLIQNEKFIIYEFQDIDEIELPINETNQSLSPLDAYIAYTKYLLLEANNFQLNSVPLMCTDLDPNKEAILVFENSTDGIYLCDACPYLPPFDKMLGIIINQNDNIPQSTMHNLEFDQCFINCVDDKQCIGYSYSETNKTCLTFSHMRIDNDRLQLANQEEKWTTIIIKQPTGLIQNWIYIRNTRMSGNGKKQETDTFLECLQFCQVTMNCLSMTYNFHSKWCQLFDVNENDNNNMYLSYGYISAINFQLIYGNITNRWRFSEEETFSNDNEDVNGCNRLTGCQECLKTKSSSTFTNNSNLPICPMITNIQHEKELKERKEDICMTKCLMQRDPLCIAIEFDELTLDCQYITSYGNWTPIEQYQGNKRRYWLQDPQQKFQFIPQCDFYSSTLLLPFSSTSVSFDKCHNSCHQNIQCQKFSYDFNTYECKMAGDRPGHINKNSTLKNRHCFIRPLLINNNFTSIRMSFDRILNYSFVDQNSYIKQDIVSCPSTIIYDTCLDNCLNTCLFNSPLNLTCQYVSIKYVNQILTCTYFQNKTTIVENESSEIYIRYFNSKITLDVIDEMPLFYPTTDTRACFYPASLSSNEQTYSTLNGYQTTLIKRNETERNSITLIRQRRFLGALKKAFKWIGDKIVKPVFHAVKEIVLTPIKAIKTIDHLVKGNTKAAKDEFMSIGIVKDVKSFGENIVKVGKAIGKGDVKGAFTSLADVGMDALAVVPLPGVGKAASKIGKGMKNSLDKARTGAKNQLTKSTRQKNDRKKKDGKREHCKRRQLKRQLAGSKHDRDCDDDDDDDDRNRAKCSKPSVNTKKDKIKTRSVNDCHAKSIGSKCKYECEFLHQPLNDASAICQKDTVNKKRAFWKPAPKCEPESCPNGNYPLITIETNNINAYVILFDKHRKLPIWSMCMLDKKNDLITPDGKRTRGYTHHPCKELKGFQADQNAYKLSGYDHGHLTPSEILSYSRDASFSSNLRINLAPQNPVTNKISWRMIEAHIRCHNHKSPPSLVVTGVCPSSRGKTKGITGVDIPSCFWKMICYKRQGQTHVVGFISDNSKITKADRAELIKILKPVSQAEVLTHLKSNPNYFALKNPFIAGFLSAVKGRSGMFSVNSIECASAMSLDKTEANIWHKDLLMGQAKRDQKKNSKKSKRQTNNDDDDDERREVRGCTRAEAKITAALFGLSSLSVFDEANYDIIEGNDEIDAETDSNDDETPDEGGDNISQAAKCGKRIIGYYPSWGTGKISSQHAQRLTHIIFAFFEVDSNGNIFLGSADRIHSTNVEEDIKIARQRLERLVRLQNVFPNIKYMFAVGGWENSQYFSSIAASPEKRVHFIASTLKLLDEYHMNGIDIDWEHPVTGGAIEGMPDDKQNYVTLMKELRQALDNHRPGYLLTFASAAGQWTLDPGYDLPALLKYADFVNIMTYDFFGAWESKWGAYTGPPAPLYFGMPPRFSGKTNVHWTVKYYVCKTNQPHKINMGVPFYGRFWKNVDHESIDPSDSMWRKASAVNGKFVGGFASWNEIKDSWLTNANYKEQFHEKTKSTFAFNNQEQIYLGYESPTSLKYKVDYAADNNLGGLMIWAIDQDDVDLTMMKIVGDAPLCKHTDPSTTFYKCSPLSEKRWWTMEDSEERAGMCGRSAPLYKGYYAVCDPDDPGYSCCSPDGYCGKSNKHCTGLGINYEENPHLLIEEPVRPTIDPPLWYLLDAPDGKRGRCGSDILPISGNIFPICNPDDKTAHCCSNGGYCGTGDQFCACDGCIDFKKNPSYRFKSKH
ncbi:unnamed protein product [Adineta steineri]|uniref:Chitinase n=1 Tax=Adineta steineri TaxID=433720 RepID=A0A815VN96_9BILA|nr:unnamed protein product [Adineta steineri]